ncbi:MULTISPECIES: F0F1 ATP synthase subunit delta [unclassified Microbacterium]|uniref:F0F1 ATP synthase subunit delta n=1 Tax=unclassified Microbacterium TaxID=2609290 RepID=UPI000CFD502D|nr:MULTISPECIES: F0F1 ATP synthase subunit delta [unclassified Microbacterium]PQZ61351.1 F0F1 ATP synthase subunit delta [Microbacterium sp. MYb43]PQZ82562.1 F0F1 ATP synthase subunit delta [Microbacterium sp. MYb40]PRB23738.1 F0F1 ATP synthase subunit delta [Microbacterium sp. MYb54]PRB29633.1 F0F1 ATP synthase subunit delta [Microbacterium sp. MYb50]PRB71009.1 F0F1 ATP synthase subunit delta [Microbacterium sp. MYb24]
MGSATTQALAASIKTLAAAKDVSLDTARELFAAAGAVSGSSQLSGALADPSAPAAARQSVVAAVFGGFSADALSVLKAAVAEHWSNAGELVDGIEELAISAAAIAEPGTDIEGELFSFSRVIATNPELELALGSRLGGEEAKVALVERLLAAGSTGAASKLIITSLVRQPRGRRVRRLLNRAMSIVSTQRGRVVATVHTAAALSDAQRARLSDSLSRRYAGQVSLNVVIDPAVVGGLRVQIADDVIDGSISARLADLRQKLAG